MYFTTSFFVNCLIGFNGKSFYFVLFLACNVDNCEKCLSDDVAKCETCKTGFKLDNDACNGKSTVSFNYVIAIVLQRNSK